MLASSAILQDPTTAAAVAADLDLTRDGWLTLAILALILVLFVWNRLRIDVVAILGTSLLVGLGIVTPQEGISGFANEATITVAMMLILSGGLVRTGALDGVARWMTRMARGSEIRLLVLILIVVIPVSAFINNTAAVAVLLPIVLGVSAEMGAAPSRLLMPLSFGSQLGGTLTLIGTSTNLVVAALVVDLGFERIGLFDITAPAAVVVAVGVLYLLTIGRRLVPHRPSPQGLLEIYELHDYVTALRVRSGSPLTGRSLAESRFGERYGLQVVRIEREAETITAPRSSTVVREGDLLLVEGKVADIAEVQERAGVRIAGTAPALRLDSEDGSSELAEILVPPRSRFRNRTLRQLRFRGRYGISALGVRRHGEPIHEPIGDVKLRPGDILLVQGSRRVLRQLHEEGLVSLIGLVGVRPKRRRRMRLALAIMTGVVLLPALGITTILVSALFGVLAMLLTGCIDPDDAYADLDGQVLVLLAALIPLGIALQTTGAATVLASLLAGVSAPLGPFGVLACLYLITTILTEIVSNAATAVVMTPVAVSLALSLQLSPMPFVLGVMFAASNSFATPIGYQTNLFIYGPGGYHFRDYLKVGGPLSLIIAAAATLVIPLFFPF